MIPFLDLKAQYKELRPLIQERINQVLDHGQYIMGPEVAELEGKLAAYVGSKHCITVASGTEALLISLMALGVGRGDEVITTPFTFVATAEVIALLGATPVFVDIEPDTCNIDASLLEEAITPQTKAIIPVSLFGQTSDMDEINAIGDRYEIPVVEDAAQSFGTIYKGRKSCNLSTIGCTSFFPSKSLGCYGDGGAIFTNDDGLLDVMQQIRVHGQKSRYEHVRIGLGGRMDTLQCAVVLAKLDKFDWELERRVDLGWRYKEALAACSAKVESLSVRPYRTCIYTQFTVLVNNRDSVKGHLQQLGIPTAIHYSRPLNRQDAYKDISLGRPTPVADDVASRVISLPMGPYLSEVEQDNIVFGLQSVLKESVL